MTESKPEPKSTLPARVMDPTPRNLWIALSLLIASLIITIFAALYTKVNVEAVAQRAFGYDLFSEPVRRAAMGLP